MNSIDKPFQKTVLIPKSLDRRLKVYAAMSGLNESTIISRCLDKSLPEYRMVLVDYQIGRPPTIGIISQPSTG